MHVGTDAQFVSYSYMLSYFSGESSKEKNVFFFAFTFLIIGEAPNRHSMVREDFYLLLQLMTQYAHFLTHKMFWVDFKNSREKPFAVSKTLFVYFMLIRALFLYLIN